MPFRCRPLSGPSDDYEEIDIRKACTNYEIPVEWNPTPPASRTSDHLKTPQNAITPALFKAPSVPLFDAPEPPMEMSVRPQTTGHGFENEGYDLNQVKEEPRDSFYMKMSA